VESVCLEKVCGERLWRESVCGKRVCVRGECVWRERVCVWRECVERVCVRLVRVDCLLRLELTWHAHDSCLRSKTLTGDPAPATFSAILSKSDLTLS